MFAHLAPLDLPRRVLMGPGPSEVAPSVLLALAKPTLGHLDPKFFEVMDQIAGMLRAVYSTANELTLPISGTGSAGMETALANLLEPGDRALIAVSGYFGARMAEIAKRCGAEVTVVEGPWGRALDPESVRKAAAGRRYQLLGAVHAETSTGVVQDVAAFGQLAGELGALLCIDAVTSLGILPLPLDAWDVDAAYSCSQKGLSCPPGLSPVSFSPRAAAAVERRKQPPPSWYLDLRLLRAYWKESGERVYHHTAPANMLYALHEALRLVLEEGLEARTRRHRRHGAALAAGLEAMGLKLRVPAAERLPQLTTVAIPEGVQDAAARRFLLDHYSLEIGGGLGPMKGNTWRIGLMGISCSRANVELCLGALRAALTAQGWRPAGDPLAAAGAAYAAAGPAPVEKAVQPS